VWDDHVLRRLIANDIYCPHTFKEIVCLVTPDVAARLDPDEQYGITVVQPQKDNHKHYHRAERHRRAALQEG
jgi:hypothetical protein